MECRGGSADESGRCEEGAPTTSGCRPAELDPAAGPAAGPVAGPAAGPARVYVYRSDGRPVNTAGVGGAGAMRTGARGAGKNSPGASPK